MATKAAEVKSEEQYQYEVRKLAERVLQLEQDLANKRRIVDELTASARVQDARVEVYAQTMRVLEMMAYRR